MGVSSAAGPAGATPSSSVLLRWPAATNWQSNLLPGGISAPLSLWANLTSTMSQAAHMAAADRPIMHDLSIGAAPESSA